MAELTHTEVGGGEKIVLLGEPRSRKLDAAVKHLSGVTRHRGYYEVESQSVDDVINAVEQTDQEITVDL